jgi:5-(carboxyamino)imidazole ribonucleotide synthase
MILPGSTLGMLGGGQLGRMFVTVARTMGYKVIVFEPDKNSPAAQLADAHICADYNDFAALDKLGKECVAITTEFENVSAEALQYLTKFCPVRPSSEAVSIAQDRIKEKNFLQTNGFKPANFAIILNSGDLKEGVKKVGLPAILKLSRSGYDGKGQRLVKTLKETENAFAELNNQPCVLEELIDIQIEISVIVVRGVDGQTVAYPPSENRHRSGILDVSIVPARISPELSAIAINMTQKIATLLNYCGVLAVEYFVLKDGSLRVNEFAPRPHNTGHYTIDACHTSQFEQQVRAMCGLTLGDTTLFSPVTMINLLGDVWPKIGEPNWGKILKYPNTKLHLYGKKEARPGRKMGHFTCLASNVEIALAEALKIQLLLK